MSITRERLAELEVWAWDHSHGNTEYMKTKAYGRALLKAVEAEMEVVGYVDEMYGLVTRVSNPFTAVQLTTLPLVKDKL